MVKLTSEDQPLLIKKPLISSLHRLTLRAFIDLLNKMKNISWIPTTLVGERQELLQFGLKKIPESLFLLVFEERKLTQPQEVELN